MLAQSTKPNVYFLQIENCCHHQVAEGQHLQHNREAGANPAQSRYCNWYASHRRRGPSLLATVRHRMGR